MPNEKKDDGFVPLLFVSQGLRENPRGELILRLQRVAEHDEHTLLGEPLTFDANKNTRRLYAGMVYSMESKPDCSTVRPSTAMWKGAFADPARAAEWQALSQAAVTARQARKQEKSETNQALLTALAPFRKAYWRTNDLGQRALEVLVLKALRTRPSHNE